MKDKTIRELEAAGFRVPISCRDHCRRIPWRPWPRPRRTSCCGRLPVVALDRASCLAQGLTALQAPHLTDTQVTEEEIAALRAALPDLEITRWPA